MPPLAPWRPTAHRPPDLVLHPALLLEWSGIIPHTNYASRLMPRMPHLVSAVPILWSQQLTGLVLRWERAGRVTAQGAERCFAWVYAFQFVIDPEGPALAWTDILALARAHSISVRDAAYLELALRLNLPLATTDATLVRAAGAAGVPILTP